MKIEGNCVTLVDNEALEMLKRFDPAMPDKMVERASGLPVYDDREVMVSVEYFLKTAPPALALFSYILGNDDEKLDGWVVRIFIGVTENSQEHIAIMQCIQEKCEIYQTESID